LHLTTFDLDSEDGLLKGDDNKIRKASFRNKTIEEVLQRVEHETGVEGRRAFEEFKCPQVP
jgi:hypothetical protein